MVKNIFSPQKPKAFFGYLYPKASRLFRGPVLNGVSGVIAEMLFAGAIIVVGLLISLLFFI